MIVIDCSELSAEEKLALAMQISHTLDGIATALVKGEDIVLDKVSQEKPERFVVKEAVEDFIPRRKDAAHYFIEEVGERVVVHSADPASAMRKKAQNQLPPQPCGEQLRAPVHWTKGLGGNRKERHDELLRL